MQVTAIIAAAGSGRRFGGAELKQLIPIRGRAILEWSVAAFVRHPSIHEVVVAVPQQLVDDPPPYLRNGPKTVRVVCGGERRQDSVANGFRAASPESEIFVVHDAARPFASADLIDRTIAAAARSGAAVAAVEARDTVKIVAHTSAPLVVGGTLPRTSVYLAQTPQAFLRSLLAEALAGVEDATDEAALVEKAGHEVVIVEGEPWNIKVTTPDDVPIAEAIAAERDAMSASVQGSSKAPRTGRAGTGYDLHRLVAGRPLIVGGVAIASERGALGHSDADVVCHAVVDAVLGAAGLGDIGRHFPDVDPRWKDASSLDLLARAAALVEESGHEVGNVDVTVVLEKPRLRDHIDQMRANVATVLKIDPARVSVKAKTNEGVDAIGRGEAIAAYAIALIRSR
jgi:2-C-methyl-D-erythritol 4-phosphate cytidylyltransferase/2-C-methyl-D-erythritol 2,4-cyclodiphosphate synthase